MEPGLAGQMASTLGYAGSHMAWRTRSARPSSGTSDSPSAWAARATASATAADTSRRLVTGGSTAAPGWSASVMLARALAAAASMPSLTRRARLTVTPSPRPGKMSALLAWATWYWTPA